MAQLPSNSVAGYAADLMEKYSQTDYTKAATQHTILQTMAAKQKMESDQLQQQQTTQYLAALQARDAAMGRAGKDVGSNDENTSAISDDTVTSPVEQSIKEWSRKEKEQSELAHLAEANGRFAQAKEHDTLAKDYAQQVREAQVKVMDQKRKDMAEIANVMRDVRDQDSLKATLEQVQAQFGKGARNKLEAQLPHDPYTLEPVWNDQAKQVVARYASQFKDAGVVAREAATKSTAETAAARLEQKKVEDKEKEHIDNVRAGIAQQSVNIAAKREARLATAAKSREENAAKKADKAKDPNSSEARATAKLLSDQLDMPADIAGKAAYDYLRRRSEAIKDGEDDDTAEEMARDYVTSKFSKGTKGEKNWFSPDVAAKPATYGKSAELPAGIPSGSTPIGKTPEGKIVYKSADGKHWTE